MNHDVPFCVCSCSSTTVLLTPWHGEDEVNSILRHFSRGNFVAESKFPASKTPGTYYKSLAAFTLPYTFSLCMLFLGRPSLTLPLISKGFTTSQISSGVRCGRVASAVAHIFVFMLPI